MRRRHAHVTTTEPLGRLERYTGRISRLIVGQHELLRFWVKERTASRGLNEY